MKPDLSALLTLAEANAVRRAQPKGAEPSRLQVKVAKDDSDETRLAAWRGALWRRHQHRCVKCGVHCKKLSIKVLDPRRGECHHVWNRDEREVRYDVRNGLLLCLRCHEQVTGKVNERYAVVGTAWFRSKAHRGRRYINCAKPVRFQRIA